MRVEVQDGDWLVTVMLRERAEDREHLSEERVNTSSTIEPRPYNRMISAECDDERMCPSFRSISYSKCFGIDGGMVQQRIVCSLHLL